MLKHMLFASVALVVALPLAAQDTQASEPEVAKSDLPTMQITVPTQGFEPGDWGVEGTDLEIEDGYFMGVLDNGMRYVFRQNATPKGTALVRMEVDTGRLDERDNERGIAHYVEHMAFNGSTNVPEGEMIKLLERLGLAFGADTNASTAFDYTQYRLDLPNNDPELLDTALFLMRETASELLFDEEAVERERGVMLSERRDRTNYARLNAADTVDFFFPGSRLSERFPTIDREDIGTVDAATLRGFWERNYVPEKTTLIIVGDFAPREVLDAITKHFASWEAKSSEPQPAGGPVDFEREGLTHIYTDPALTESIAVAANAPWIDRPDTRENRREAMLRGIGYAILGRRFTRLTREENPPFRSASAGTGSIFEAARQTTLSVTPVEGQLEQGLAKAVETYRQFLQYGVSEAEIAEQLARRRTSAVNALRGQNTRSHNAYVSRLIGLARSERMPISPLDSLEMFDEFAADVTPDAVMEAIRADVVTLDNPLIRYQGKEAPEGGADALRSAWNTAMAAPVAPPEEAVASEWAYTDFGEPASVVSDTVGDALGIRRIRFSNGVMLNLKKTDLAEDRISVAVSIDGGNYLNTKDEPLKTGLIGLLAAGGLGAHTQDELQTILAGRSTGFSISSSADSFTVNTTTTPADFELQMQLIAAYLTDPAYRPEPITRFRNSLNDFYSRLTATPGAALGNESRTILSDADPRFVTPEEETLRGLTFEYLREQVTDRLQNGAMEIGLVGDFDEEQAIALVAKTLGALPEREAAFGNYPESRQRSFTADRREHIIYHDGEADQAIVRSVWPTRDYSDPVASVEFGLLRSVTNIVMTDSLREELGKAYSPGVGSTQSRYYDGYGTFSVSANVEVAEVQATREAIDATIAKLRSEPVSDDILQRARQPILESFDNALKTNGSWMGFVRRAQTQTDRIERFQAAKERYEAVTAERLREVAAQYLVQGASVDFTVLPRPTEETAATDAE